MKNRSS